MVAGNLMASPVSPGVLRPIVKMNRDASSDVRWVTAVLQITERCGAISIVEKLLERQEEAGLAASVLTINEQVLRVSEFEIVNRRSRETAKANDFNLGDLHARPSMMRTTSMLLSENSAA
jgi:hypothetical protein